MPWPMEMAQQPPCLCRRFHVDCSPQTCPQAQHASTDYHENHYTIKAFRESAAGTAQTPPCETCASVVRALTEVDSIKQILGDTVRDLQERGGKGICEGAAEDYEMMLVELEAPVHALASPAGRRFIRTCAARDGSTEWRHFNVWRDEADGWEKSGCRALPPLACHPVLHTDDGEATEQLRKWIKTCDKVHGCVQSQDARAPTRLVQVSSNEVRVVQTDGELTRYTTLSHRWGNNEGFVLLKENLVAWSACDIPWGTIPQTYRDAIEVTRKLGVDYIWIDTMCIVQNDADDWRQESTRMKTVYGGSYLNIAANCASGSNAGLFVRSSLMEEFETHEVPEGEQVSPMKGTLRIRQQPHFTHNAYGDNERANSLLLSRGWILQERLLAPRVVYYDQGELKWECYGGTDCLCGGMLAISNFNLEHRESLGLRKGRLRPDDDVDTDGHSTKKLPIRWMRIIERYSMCLLTFDSDRMVALAGIAEQAYKTGRGGRYLAGHWEQDLAHQLCWQVQDTYRKPMSTYIAPSWSWMSVFGTIWFSNRMDYHCKASEIDVRITQVEVTLADKMHETGPVTGGFLKVDGRVVEFETSIGHPASGSDPHRFWPNHKETRMTLHYGFEPDYIMAEAEAENLKTVFLLYWGKMWEDRKTFLVLRHAENAEEPPHQYEKLGTYTYIDGREHDPEFYQFMEWARHEEGLVII